jgi:hypothetical protein
MKNLISCIQMMAESPLTRQLLPEQIRVLWSHVYRIYYYQPLLHFVREFRNEVEQIAKREIEPGMFKDEDIL